MKGVGKLRHRVSIETKAQTPDGSGGFIEGWAKLADVWASIAPVTSWERVQAEQVQARALHRITIRFREDVSADMRLVSGTRIFAMRGVNDPDDRRHWLILDCEEGAPA